MSAAPFVVMAKPVGPLCNLRCSYCYYLGKTAMYGRGERFAMRDDVLEAYVRSTIAASPGPVVHFVWHGGEPALAGVGFYRRALELQRRHLPGGWTVVNNLQTNGTLLDDAWCAFLAENRFAVGISIDGPARLHDACRVDRRGRPSHERVMLGLRRLRAHGIEPDVLCTLNAHNAAHPAEVYRFFLEEHVTWLQFLPVVVRDGAGGVSPPSVAPEQMGEFLCTVFDEWVRYDVGRIAVQGFLESLLVAGGRSANLCVMAETCGRVPALEHDGSVFACDHFVEPEHLLGNVSSDGLGTLVESPALLAFGSAKSDALPGRCRDCPVLALCNGGCPKDRLAAAPEGDGALSYLCAGYRRFYGHALPHLERMAALVRAGREPGAIMVELEAAEREARAAWRTARRNDPCPCGSGTKYKHCCMGTRRR
ncbi:MAG: anaerobic sulfatase maturase [Acidimicrobiales bacterium]